MALFLPGYSGVVWNSIKSTLSYASANLNSADPAQTKALAKAVAATLKNGSQAMAADALYLGLQQLYSILAELTPLPLNISAADFAFMKSRIDAVQAAALSVASVRPNPLLASKQLQNGNPAIPDPGYMEWLINFDFETSPAGLTVATLQSQAQAAATAWVDVATALRTSGVAYSGTTYNAAELMGRAAQVVANLVTNASVTGSPSANQMWNQFVAMPTITRVVAAMVSDPTDATAQKLAVARYVTLNTLKRYNQLVLSLRQTAASNVHLGTVRKGDTLMTFANRMLGDYTAWRDIAQINGLEPPYISNTPGSKVATPGQQLFLPSPNRSGQLSPQTGPIASYVNNYLGVDKYLGQLNQPMLTWTGDFQTISGYDNLAISLGRRLQTTMSHLIYHNMFGSRIPPQVGKAMSNNELALIQEYAKSSLSSDPRVNKVLSATAIQKPNYAIELKAVVLPNGLGQEQVTVNEVIGPA